jgi:hypothetical protein
VSYKFENDFFIPIPANIYDDFQEGKLSLSAYIAYTVLLRQVDFETGIWSGCADKLAIATAEQLEQRTMQRALGELRVKGYIKIFPKKRGMKGNYPVLIHNYPIRFGRLDGYRLNALKTTSPKTPVYEHDSQNIDTSPPDGGQVTDKSPSPVTTIPDTPDTPEIPEAPDGSSGEERETRGFDDLPTTSSQGAKSSHHRDGYLPLMEMRDAVFEQSGERVFFPQEHYSRYRQLLKQYSADELIQALRDTCGHVGETFDYRFFSAFFLRTIGGDILAVNRRRAMTPEKPRCDLTQ